MLSQDQRRKLSALVSAARIEEAIAYLRSVGLNKGESAIALGQVGMEHGAAKRAVHESPVWGDRAADTAFHTSLEGAVEELAREGHIRRESAVIGLDHWPHRWFGFWREYGRGYERCPSIHDFVRPDLTARYDKPALRRYLTTAQDIALTSRAAFPHPFTGARGRGAIGQMTDGVWTWMSDLADYIEAHDVAIPTAWYRQIEARGFVPPAVDVSDPAVVAALDRPPVG